MKSTFEGRGLIFGAMLIAALALFTSGAGQAGFLRLGEDYQESSSTATGTPQQTGSCQQQIANCFFQFAVVPAGWELIVTHVSCLIYHSDNEVRKVALFPMKGNGMPERLSFLQSSTWPSPMPGFAVLVNTEVKQLFRAGERPVIQIEYTGASFTEGTCTVAGVLRKSI